MQPCFGLPYQPAGDAPHPNVDLRTAAPHPCSPLPAAVVGRRQEYAAAGARFTKWRAALKVGGDAGLPSERCIEVNAAQLAEQAAICQVGAQGMAGVPLLCSSVGSWVGLALQGCPAGPRCLARHPSSP